MVPQFKVELKQLALRCEFETILKKVLQDHFVPISSSGCVLTQSGCMWSPIRICPGVLDKYETILLMIEKHGNSVEVLATKKGV